MVKRIRRVPVDDVDLAYEDLGAGDRALVLVHGFTGSRDDFAGVADALTDLGRLVLLDQRGHGDSSNPGTGYTFERLVADLAGLFDAAGIERADLLGHSMGGMVALRYALDHPARVASLILMDSGARGAEVLHGWFTAGADDVRRNGMGPTIERMVNGPLLPEDEHIARIEGEGQHRARHRRKLEALDPEAFIALGPLLARHTPVVHRLGELRCPTTVLVGEHDVLFLDHSKELANGIPGAALVQIPGGGHSPQKSARDLWVDAVRCHVHAARRDR